MPHFFTKQIFPKFPHLFTAGLVSMSGVIEFSQQVREEAETK